MRAGVLQLQRWGLLDEVAAAGTPPVRRTVFDYGDESVAVSIKPCSGVDALYAPRRTVIDALLVDAAEQAGADLRFGAPVSGLLRDDTGCVAGVVVSDRRRGTEWTARAPLVIGADGRNSLIARQVGAVPVARGRASGSALYGYWANLPTDGYEWLYRPGMTAGTIPTNDGLTCVFLALPASRLDRAVRADGAAAVFGRLSRSAGLGDRLDAAQRVERIRHVHGLPAGYLRTAHGDGWALVGDAGHWLDPVSAHGMTAALRDAAFLARAVLTSSPGDPRRHRALADYQATRDRLSLQIMSVTEEIASLAGTCPGFGCWCAACHRR